MFAPVLHVLATPLLKVWLATSTQSWRQLPRPLDEPSVHSPGIDPDRVLVVGSGAVVGYGVLSYSMSLSGQLAGFVSRITGRGMDIDIVAAPDLDVPTAQSAITALQLERFDAILLSFGSGETLRLLPRRVWRQQLNSLLDSVEAQSSADLAILLMAVPPVPTALRLPRVYRGLLTRKFDVLTKATVGVVAAHPRVTYVPFLSTAEILSTEVGTVSYADWARRIAPLLAQAMQSHPSRIEHADEPARVDALRRLYVLDGPRDARLEQLVETTRDLFGASGAALNLIDSDRVQVKAAATMPRGDLPRNEVICNLTIERPGLLVIDDVTADARFNDLPWASGASPLRFYAGYPVEAPDGHRVGALCIVDTRLREFGDAEATLLRELALQAQTLLWHSAASHA